VAALAAAGAAIGVGVDGAASNEAPDMLSEVHAAWLMQRARAGMATRAIHQGGRGEDDAAAVVTVEDVVGWGTSSGADLLGLSGLGRLAPGQAADIAVYRLDHPRYFGLLDPAIGPVASGGSADLAGLWVAGREVVRDGVIPGLDLAELRAAALREVLALRT
jgi:cytosine/adenosine deaminase-related metal-dependent hydrolase